ncbi:GCN5-related N-acetyltransferase [Thioalkalivibrio nitratireducens DSM 14787]|uniref:GCN5-related N-acetyltransferase n=1 Tax=Thioalkalivibrio nitratireducens (strain DSM 14787 / UNIQEM 213 / ALEN2) TaxID=1255043 RepID=L0E291_THIND|nr:GNAT family N-acetyltransferase [Thioalkalivibrio nitratireducens]AGA35393.1 GCN5-related N-acetyltransferase [Thioalkalivibrio nitratireducens DSM 14787]
MPDWPVEEIRDAGAADLESANAVIEAAVGTWNLPERVKRLAMPSYRYSVDDLDHLSLRVLLNGEAVVGISAWEPADPRDSPRGVRSAMLLHGLYVSPAHHRQGLATRLLDDGIRRAEEARYEGILVRAQAEAEGFFVRRGFNRLPVQDPVRDYAARYWRALA